MTDTDTAESDRQRYLEDFSATRTSLPIYGHREALIAAVNAFPVVVVVGDTGSGKTTQLPQFLLEDEPTRRIAVTQPRRIAAIAAATRVAAETGARLGGRVGFAVRFAAARSAATRLAFVTDGTLLQTGAAALDVVVLDEAHERSLETDVLFGVLKAAVRARPDLKLVVMSATLDADKFCAFFGGAPLFAVPGRMHKVDLLYARDMSMAALKSQVVAKAVEAVLHIHKAEAAGDVLVFLTGQQEIETACRLIRQEADSINPTVDLAAFPEVASLALFPIYAALDTPEQKSVFRPAEKQVRKVVVATNIAQTSVTIPGIRYVVDCGFVKEKIYDASTGMDALCVVPISKAAATQRAGRAGRTAPGKVFRLYSKESFLAFQDDTTPEIQRSSLISTVLSLKRIGVEKILEFEFIDAPDSGLMVDAMKQLFFLDALDQDGNLTLIGKQMSALPCHPSLSRSLIAASTTFHCAHELLTLAAILSTEEVYHHPRQEHKRVEAETAHAKFAHKSGDHVALLRVYNAWERSGESEEWCRSRWIKSRSLRAAKNARSQLRDVLNDLGLPI
ncbi:P-loop containing nucleoside triphosphate hydrolase protein, partial [Obelidium mucronatum]